MALPSRLGAAVCLGAAVTSLLSAAARCWWQPRRDAGAAPRSCGAMLSGARRIHANHATSTAIVRLADEPRAIVRKRQRSSGNLTIQQELSAALTIAGKRGVQRRSSRLLAP